MSVALSLHVLAAVIWVGGMFFAYMALRPSAATLLEPPLRLSLWKAVFSRFFPWVWLAIIILLASGYWMIFQHYGGMKTTPLFVHIMHGLGLVMMLIFLHVFFAPYRRLTKAVNNTRWPDGGKALNQIRILIALNLLLGLITVAVASGGKYLLS